MKKRKKNVIIGIGVVMALAFALLFFGTNIIQTSYGASYMSISNIELDGTSKIRVYGSVNGAEALAIDWSSSEMNQYLQGEDVRTTKSVSGMITMDNPKREFLMATDSSKIFYEYTASQISLFSSCENNVPYGYEYAGNLGTTITKRNCLYKKSLGNYGYFTGQTIDDTDVNINIGGSTGTLNPSSGQNVVILNDGKTKVEWVGNLVNTYGLESPPNYGAFFSNSRYQKLIDSDAYSRYLNSLNTMADGIGASSISNLGIIGTIFNVKSFSTIESAVNNYNNQIDNILIDKTNTYENSVNANDVSIVNNRVVVDLKTATSFPTFMITLDADKVGLVSLEGTPDIVSCPTRQELLSGESSNPTLSVKNTGESDGQFYGNIVCDSSSISGTISEVYVRSGQTVDIPIQISGVANTEDITSSCKITVTDRKSQDSDTCNFNVNVEYLPNVVCEPESVKCFGADTLRTCNADGSSYTDSECEFGCQVIDNANDECKGSSGVPDDFLALQQECSDKAEAQPWLGWTFSSETKEPSLLKKIITLGFAGEKTKYTCKPAFLPYYIGGGIVLIIATVIFIRTSNKRKSKLRGKRK